MQCITSAANRLSNVLAYLTTEGFSLFERLWAGVLEQHRYLCAYEHVSSQSGASLMHRFRGQRGALECGRCWTAHIPERSHAASLAWAAAALAASALPVFAQTPDAVRYFPANGMLLITKADHTEAQCRLNTQLENATPVFNWNKTIVTLGNVEYVSVRSVTRCAGGVVQIERIPDKAGTVTDVNVASGLYLSVAVANSSPLTYTALVAKLGSREPVASFPGMYSAAKSSSDVLKESFTYVDSRPGRISPDGRYVSVDGSMRCTPEVYPGVWDLKRKQKVVRENGCESLFTSY
jgi:hypothetical protein